MKVKSIRRCLLLLCAFALVLTFFMTPAFADGIVEPVTGISVKASSATSGPTLSSGTVTITRKGSFLSTGTTATITITNSGDKTAKISFNYAFSGNGAAKLDGASVSSGTYSATIAAGASVTMTLNGSSGSKTGTLKLSNFSRQEAAESSNVTVDYDSNMGSVTVAGSAAGPNSVHTISASGATLAATTKSGYSFVGWIDTADNSVISTSASFSYVPTADSEVRAVFAGASTEACFWAVGKAYLFENLNTAIAFAGSQSNKTIVLAADGQLSSGTYTIPSGVTLVIPYNAAGTIYTNCDAYAGEVMTAVSRFRTLRMADGAKLVINGSMNVAGQFTYTNSGGQSGSPTGPLGFVEMASNSEIVVNGSLYAYGYIIGDGAVNVNSGATVYEILQMPEYRGGDQSTGMDNKVFPLSQFYVQNIEVPMTLAAGATEKTFSKIYASKMYFDSGITLFGSGGMFELTSGSVTKWYDGTTDRLHIEINGATKMNSVNLTLNGMLVPISVSSKDYVLPIHGGFTIHITKDGSLTIPSTQDVLLQPGAQVIIDQGASVTVNSKLFVYDTAQWGAYCSWGHAGAGTGNCWDTPVIPVSYSPTRTNTRNFLFPRGLFTDASGKPIYISTGADIGREVFNKNSGDKIAVDDLKEFLENYLPDASIRVEGTLKGNIYTTAGGANIYSENGTGVFIQTATENATVYQFMMAQDCVISEHSSGYVAESATPAKLNNGENYVNTQAGEYRNCTTHGWYAGESCTSCTPAHTHDYKAVVTAPTCTTAGYTTYTCACGDTYTADEVAATGHSYNAVVTAPTCTDGGYTTYTCSCGDTYVADEVAATGHDYDAVVTAPTCTAAGYTTYTCSCGDTYVADEVAATGHSYTSEETEAPTCTVAGVMTYTCACGDTYTEEIAAKGHTLTRVEAKAPTCTEAGYEAYEYCSACDYTTFKEVAATGHKYDAVVTPPTCTAAGYTTYTCACGDTYTADEVAAKSHKYESVYTAPTFEDDGFWTYTCHCGDTYTVTDNGSMLTAVAKIGDKKYETLAEAVADANSGDTIVLLADATETYIILPQGVTLDLNGKTVTATIVGRVKINGGTWNTPEGFCMAAPSGDAMYHTTDAVIVLDANWTLLVESGTITLAKEWRTLPGQTVTVGAGATFEIPEGMTFQIRGNAYINGTVVNNGTVEVCEGGTLNGTVLGKLKFTGGDLITAEGYKMIGANADYYHTTDAVLTMDANGSITLVSGKVTLEQNWWTLTGQILTIGKDATFEIPEGIQLNVLSEVIVEGTANVNGKVNLYIADATVTADAGITNIITSAGDCVIYENGKYVVHNHTEVIDAAVSATCTTSGLTEGKHCSVCNEVLVAQTVVDALGHDYEAVVTAPTCTEKGYTTYTCACGDSYKDNYVDATGHDHVGVETKAPTCTTAGEMTYTCSCGDSYTEEIAAKGHKYDAVVTAPTCTVDGYTTYTCSCGDTYTDDVVPATGHAYNDVIDSKDATCGADGYVTKKCVCGETETIVLPATGAHTYDNACDVNCNVCGNIREVEAHKYVGSVTTAATCSKDGVMTYTCSECGNSYTEVIPATGDHTPGADATCTTAQICTNCENVLVAAKGHTPGKIFVDNIVNGTDSSMPQYDAVTMCIICGHESSRETIVLSQNAFAEMNMQLSDNLQVRFRVYYSAVKDEGYYVEIKRISANTGEIKTTIVNQDYSSDDWIVSGQYDVILVNDVAAAEMTDIFYVTLYNRNHEVVGVYTNSVRNYAMNLIAQEEAKGIKPNARLTMYVDMLNYGAQAQIRFNYAVNDLANCFLTEQQQGYASEDVSGEIHESGDVGFSKTTIALESRIELNFIFDCTVVTDQMRAVVTYTDIYGNKVTQEVMGSDFTWYKNDYMRVTIGIPAACVAEIVTCTIYDGAEEVTSAESSVESYLVSRLGTNELYSAALKFMKSAYAYFKTK